MFCYKCGKELPDDAVFCSACGTAVQKAPVSQPAPAAEPKQSAPKPEKPKKEKKPGRKAIIGIAIAVLLVLALPMILKLLGFGHAPHDSSLDQNDYNEQIEEPASEPTYERVFTDPALYSFEFPDKMRFIRDGDTTQTGSTMQQNYLVSSTDAAAVREQLMWYYMFELIGDNTFVKAGEQELKFDAGNEYFIWFDHADESVNGFPFGVPAADFEIADCDLLLYTMEEPGQAIKISCWFSPDLAMREGEVFTELAEVMISDPASASEPEPEPEPAPEPQPSNSDPSVLPDFLAHDASGKFEQVKAAYSDMAVFAADDSSLSYVAENYVQVLKDMGYTVVDTEEKQKETFNVYRWYMANSAVNAETIEGDAQIYVKIMYYKNKQHSEITVAYGDGITYGGEGMTGSGSSNDFWDTCSACGGDGKCNICNGSDTVRKFQAGIGWVEQDCTSCSGGRCSFCGGTGKP